MMHSIRLNIPLFQQHADLALPIYALAQSSGCDIVAAVEEPLTLYPQQRLCVPTGLFMAIPEGYEAQIRPRSGLAWNHGITVLNTPGTIDAGYRGEIKVILFHTGDAPFVITRGMRIAQCVIAPVIVAHFVPVTHEALAQTQRQTGGFGSTGLS